MTLSDKIINDEPHEAIYVEDVKEFIKELKETYTEWWNGEQGLITFREMIDKLAGEDLK